METKTETKDVRLLVSTLKAYGAYVSIVNPGDFDPEKWTLREVDLSESTIHPKARVGANMILKSGLQVKRWVLAEEITHPVNIPWKAIGTIVGGIAMIAGAIVLLPVILFAVCLMGVLAIDPMLIAVVQDGEEEVWISVGFWVH